MRKRPKLRVTSDEGPSGGFEGENEEGSDSILRKRNGGIIDTSILKRDIIKY